MSARGADWGLRSTGPLLLSCAATVMLFGSVARADLISDMAFTLNAESAEGSGRFEVGLNHPNLFFDPLSGTYSWSFDDPDSPIAVQDALTGNIVALITRASVLYSVGSTGGNVAGGDLPVINLSFAVQAGFSDTQFTISSALLNFSPAISPAQARASAGVTVTDVNGGGAELTGLGAGGNAYVSQYNGAVPGGTTFAGLVRQLTTPSFSSSAVSESFPGGGAFAPIADPVADMSAQFHFSLTALDLASGTSNYEIIPAPAGLPLLAIGWLVGHRRRRRA